MLSKDETAPTPFSFRVPQDRTFCARDYRVSFTRHVLTLRVIRLIRRPVGHTEVYELAAGDVIILRLGKGSVQENYAITLHSIEQ